MLNTIRFARPTIARALCMVAFAAAAPAAATPDVVTWAARVENDAGPFNGTLTATFELFDAGTGGTALWTELVPSAVVVNGDVVHELGSIELLDDALIDRDNLFLQVTMNGDVLAPRTALRAVPYALRATEAGYAQEASHAADATTLAGLAAASFQFTAGAGGGLKLTGTSFAIDTSGVVTTMIADGAITSSKLANGAVTTAQIAATAVSSDKLANDAVTSVKLAAAAVTFGKIANNAVGTSQIGDDSITESDLAGSTTTLFEVTTAGCTVAKGTIQLIDSCTRSSAGCPAGQLHSCSVAAPCTADVASPTCFGTTGTRALGKLVFK